MKNKPLIAILLTVLLITVVGFIPATAAQNKGSVQPAQAVTPTPNGQINVPAFSIQILAPGPNPLVNQADERSHVASVLQGIWNGIISPITLLVSFFAPSVQMYEVHNDGSPYNLGFLFGVAIVFLLIGITAGSRRR